MNTNICGDFQVCISVPLICVSNVKLLSTFTSINFSLELPSVEEFLIFMDFKLNGDRSK